MDFIALQPRLSEQFESAGRAISIDSYRALRTASYYLADKQEEGSNRSSRSSGSKSGK